MDDAKPRKPTCGEAYLELLSLRTLAVEAPGGTNTLGDRAELLCFSPRSCTASIARATADDVPFIAGATLTSTALMSEALLRPAFTPFVLAVFGGCSLPLLGSASSSSSSASATLGRSEACGTGPSRGAPP